MFFLFRVCCRELTGPRHDRRGSTGQGRSFNLVDGSPSCRPQQDKRKRMKKVVVVHVYPLLWVYLVWQLLSVATGCSAALSVVISGSMEPQIKRGDLLFAVGPDRGDELRPGDIVLYRLPHRPEIPIVHRIIDIVPLRPKRQMLLGLRSLKCSTSPRAMPTRWTIEAWWHPLTRRAWCPRRPSWVPHPCHIAFFLLSCVFRAEADRPRERAGKVRGQVPWLGYLTILMQEIKYVVFAVIGLMVLRSILAADPQDQQQGEQRMPATKREWAWFLLMPWS